MVYTGVRPGYRANACMHVLDFHAWPVCNRRVGNPSWDNSPVSV